MMISLLRSPGFGHCLERYAQEYPMPMYTLRDPGYHCFEYALTAVPDGQSLPRIAAAAEAYSWTAPVFAKESVSSLKCGGLEFDDDALCLLALKPAFDGKGWVCRILNRSDKTVTSVVRFPEAVHAVHCASILEERGKQCSLEDGGISLILNPWKIQTFRLTCRYSIRADR
jgi:alpha-mannosidase